MWLVRRPKPRRGGRLLRSGMAVDAVSENPRTWPPDGRRTRRYVFPLYAFGGLQGTTVSRSHRLTGWPIGGERTACVVWEP
jgi:hypothetical protein